MDQEQKRTILQDRITKSFTDLETAYRELYCQDEIDASEYEEIVADWNCLSETIAIYGLLFEEDNLFYKWMDDLMDFNMNQLDDLCSMPKKEAKPSEEISAFMETDLFKTRVSISETSEKINRALKIIAFSPSQSDVPTLERILSEDIPDFRNALAEYEPKTGEKVYPALIDAASDYENKAHHLLNLISA